MPKLDLKAAYRMVPVHPDDQPLLGIMWQGETNVDQALPFGLRSAPKIFTAVADGLEWAMRQEGIKHSLYMTFFLQLGQLPRLCQGSQYSNTAVQPPWAASGPQQGGGQP